MGDLTTARPMLLLPLECPGTSDSHREETCVSGGIGRWEVVGAVRFSRIKRRRNRAPLRLERTIRPVTEQTSCCVAPPGDARRPDAEQDVERNLGWAKGRAMLDLNRQYSLGIPLISLVVYTLQAAWISTCVPIIARFVL